MPKNKKSYMNSKNILDEGLFDNLIRSLLPKSIQRKVSRKAMDVIKKDNEKLEKQIEYWKVMQKQAQERGYKALEKRFGVKIKRGTANKIVKHYYGEQLSGK